MNFHNTRITFEPHAEPAISGESSAAEIGVVDLASREAQMNEPSSDMPTPGEPRIDSYHRDFVARINDVFHANLRNTLTQIGLCAKRFSSSDFEGVLARVRSVMSSA